MRAMGVQELVALSRAVGTRREYVQGGGGNTSVKPMGGRTLLVKASGTPLGEVTRAAGWAELDLAAVLGVLDEPGLRRLRAAEREARVLARLQAAVVGGPGGRPSVESALHALLGRAVIHTHPVAVNALVCGRGAKEVRGLVREGEAPPLWVPYADPGYMLACAVRKGVGSYRRRWGREPSILLLENHGLFVSADSVEECVRLHEDWVRRCDAHFERSAPGLRPEARADSAALRRAMAGIRRTWAKERRTPIFARLSIDPELTTAALDSRLSGAFARGPLTPDQIVYTGARTVRARSASALAALLPRGVKGAAPPRVALVDGVGAFLVSDDPAKLDVIEATASAAAGTVRLAAGRGGARPLSRAARDFIVHWEAEHYRAKLLETPQGVLSGRVAVVTGAASGLGLGIAQGLVDAGCAVAFCDIDEAGLEAAVRAAGQRGRTLAVRMEVTSEGAVAAGFDRVVRHWGGIDIVVCAAGIAPAHELVEMPMDEWRRALEINLTGYFLAAREGARVMRAQGQGGAIVVVSSKSGLEASKMNSAYNATKAGELHLMRGWALELGPDGIRVNAVAPGNVFEGSKIWNPEYIKACARKRGIRPKDVIPYYISLTALGREIKRPDVAAAVVFLCSDQARCITGQTLVIDSGQVMVR